MNILPQIRSARRLRRCAGFLDLFGGNKTAVSRSETTTNVDSYNRSFNSVRNVADSNNLTIAVGADAGAAFTKSDDQVKKVALYVAGAVGLAAVLAFFFRK